MPRTSGRVHTPSFVTPDVGVVGLPAPCHEDRGTGPAVVLAAPVKPFATLGPRPRRPPPFAGRTTPLPVAATSVALYKGSPPLGTPGLRVFEVGARGRGLDTRLCPRPRPPAGTPPHGVPQDFFSLPGTPRLILRAILYLLARHVS